LLCPPGSAGESRSLPANGNKGKGLESVTTGRTSSREDESYHGAGLPGATSSRHAEPSLQKNVLRCRSLGISGLSGRRISWSQKSLRTQVSARANDADCCWSTRPSQHETNTEEVQPALWRRNTRRSGSRNGWPVTHRVGCLFLAVRLKRLEVFADRNPQTACSTVAPWMAHKQRTAQEIPATPSCGRVQGTSVKPCRNQETGRLSPHT